MKKLLSVALCGLIAFGGINLVTSCNDNDQNTPTSKYKINITAIGQTTINVSKTVQLRSSVTGTTNKNVVWESSNESIATVNNKGLVTGINEGEVEIKCSLEIDKTCFATIKINVNGLIKPTSLEIQGLEDGVAWVGDTAKLSITVLPEDASSLVTFSTSNDKVATITKDGEVSFIGVGEVSLKATSNADEKVQDSVNLTVKKGTFSGTLSSSNYDLTKQADENPVVNLSNEKAKGYNSLYFSHVKGQRYYVEATFKTYEEQEFGWDWFGVGLGSGLSDTNTRYFTYSPHWSKSANSFNKVILRDRPTTWDALTQRSQIWGENGINDVDSFNEGVKVSMIRDYNTYYYLINDKLFYVDESEKYDQTDTYPIVVCEDLGAEITNFSATIDETTINEKLNSETFKQTFYAANKTLVDYQGDNEFTIKTNGSNCREARVKSIGDQGKLVRNFEVEFDVTNLNPNVEHLKTNFAGLAINFSRYDNADTVESFVLGRSKVQAENANLVARYGTWAYPNNMAPEASWTKFLESSNALYSGETAHVKITRTIENNRSTFKLFVNNQEVNFDVKNAEDESTQERYTGSYLIWVGGEYCSAKITNFVTKSNI